MRPLGGRLDESEMLGSTPYTYYGGKGRPGVRCSVPALFWELRAKGPGQRAFRRRTSPTLWTHNHGHMYTHPHLLDTKSDTWSHTVMHTEAHARCSDTLTLTHAGHKVHSHLCSLQEHLSRHDRTITYR